MQNQTADVIVIGAGVAGLKAAHDLQAAGLSVMVLEARDRIGGRIHSLSDFAPAPIELGAELIHGSGAETWEMVKAHDIETVLLKNIQVRESNGKWQSVEAMYPDLGNMDFAEIPHTNESINDFFVRMGIRPHDHPNLIQQLEIDTASISEMNARAVYDHLVEREHEGEGYGDFDHRVIGGYDQIPMLLAAGLAIRLNTVVERVEWNHSEVVVTSVVGAVYKAQKVVVTLPIGVLQARGVQFLPDLPVEHWAAVDQIGISDIVKLHLYFDQAVLPTGIDGVLDAQGLPSFWWNASSGNNNFTGQILVGWAAGESARRLIELGEEKAIVLALENLRRLLNQPDLTPLAARMHHWNDDPYTRGAYSYVRPDGYLAREVIAQPLENALFWAGEATDKRYSTVQGAYRSGARAAREVLAVMSERIKKNAPMR